MRVRVEVTAEDIAAGIQRDCERCPMAIAATRASGRPVVIDDDGFWFADEDADSAPLPEGTQAFMRRFDNGDSVDPFAFDLEIPGEEAPHA